MRFYLYPFNALYSSIYQPFKKVEPKNGLIVVLPTKGLRLILSYKRLVLKVGSFPKG